MATQIYYLSGKCKYAKLNVPDERYGDYKLDLYLDDASWPKWHESGMQGEVKQDEGGKYVTIRRRPRQDYGGKIIEWGKPKVIDKDGNPFTDFIGDGSSLTVKVQVYDTRFKGKGKRLDTVRVDVLVPYVKKQEENSGDAPDPTKSMSQPDVGMPF